LIDQQGIVAVLKDRDVLEFLQENWNLSRGYEETGEQHEGNDDDGRQRHSELLVAHTGRDD
jgi:hypothetical protein